MISRHTTRRWVPVVTRALTRSLIAAVLFVSLQACSKEPSSDGLKAEQMTAQLSAYNHTPDYIHQYYVNDQGGGNSFAYGGGGKFSCCIIYPKTWRPGLLAKVRWTTSSSDPNATGDAAIGKWHELDVPIERYAEPGTTLNVHFMPSGKVRLVISSKRAGHPQYPGPEAPVKPAGFPF